MALVTRGRRCLARGGGVAERGGGGGVEWRSGGRDTKERKERGAGSG